MGKASRVKKSRPSSPETSVAPKEYRVESWISRPLPGLILCVLLALMVNINVLQNEFGWDDEKIINGLGASSSISEIFLPISKSGAPYYRPLVSLSYRIDYALWGKDPFGYHFSVLLFHLLNTALVFVLAHSLLSFSSNRPVTYHLSLVPVLSASLFAVHPVHSEAVAWIAGRNDVFCTTFVLASFISYLRFCRNHSKIAFFFSMLSFSLALLTKEMAVGFFFLFPLFWALSKQTGGVFSLKSVFQSRTIHLFVPVSLLAFYFLLRSQGLALPYGGSTSPTPFETISPGLLIPVFGHYVKGLLFPFPHLPYLSEIPSSLPWVVFSLFVMAFFGWTLFRAFRKFNLLVGTGLLWFVVLLAPALTVPLLGLGATTSLADRYLYGPSVGGLFVFSWLLLSRPGFLRNKGERVELLYSRVLVSVSLVLIFLLGWESYQRNTIWRNPLSFWTASVKNLKGGPIPGAIAYDNLGTAYQNRGQGKEAEAAYLKAIRMNPDFSQAHSNLGVLYKFWAREKPEYFEKALDETHESLRLAPQSIEAHNNLGDILALLGNFDAALLEYQKVLAIQPRNAKVHNNRGIIMRHQGRYPDAIREHQLALEYDPGMAEARINLGSVYLETGENTQAINEYKKGQILDPSNVIAAFGTGIAYERMGNIQRAREAFNFTLALDPGHSLALEALGRMK